MILFFLVLLLTLMTKKELKKYCHKFNRIVPVDEIAKGEPTSQTVKEYYTISGAYYTRFHSAEGALHLPVSFSPQSTHKKKLRFQAETIGEIITQHSCQKVLELGCGMGFNLCFLAETHPDVEFSGLDITPKNIKAALKKSAPFSNIRYELGNFDDTAGINGTYDLIFAVETLCYSEDLSRLVKELKAKLNPGGRLLIFDGYINADAKLDSKTEEEAYRYLSWGFAMSRFQNIKVLVSNEVKELYSIEIDRDFSQNVLPNFNAFQSGAKKVLRHPRTLRLLVRLKVISLVFIKQLAAGIFGPYFTSKAYLSYRLLVLLSKD